jgi:hypothetical protein
VPNKNTPAQISSGSVLVTSAFSASHATLDPDRACSAAQDGTPWLSKAAIRPTQMMKAGDTFLCVRCVMFSSAGHHYDRVSVGKETSSPPTTTIDDRNAPSYDRTATLDRIAQNLSLWRGSAALKPQILETARAVAASLIFTRDELLDGCPLMALSGHSRADIWPHDFHV